VDRSFQVDLRGLVDLLSHHLYSSPRVYLRELLQNAVDAVTARRIVDAAAPASIAVETDGTTLRVTDTGIGLTEPEVHEFLARIGSSSKRDELGFAREAFLGRFGIGLLSGFVVAEEITVTTRSATGGPAVRWTGRADGTYAVEPGEHDVVGSTVELRARRGAETWFHPDTVVELVRLFAAVLPVPVTVNGAPIAGGGAPWARDDGRSPEQRRADLVGLAQDALGFTPFDVVELDVPEAGLTGVAFVLPFAASPAAHVGHRVHLKGMLLGDDVPGLLPDWAFFARCVVDTTRLRPTAAREGLVDDDLLARTREALGERLRGWIAGSARSAPERLSRFLEVHHLAVKALAMHDDDMLALVEQWWPMETTAGPMTVAEFRHRYGTVRYTASVEEYRQLSGVAAAQDVPLVNGGYVYDADLLDRLDRPGAPVERLDPGDVSDRLAAVDPPVELAALPFLAVARRAVDPLGCDVSLRAFEPASVPVLYLVDRDATHQRELRATRDRVDELWAGVLSAFDRPQVTRPQLVFNHDNPTVRRLVDLTDEELVTAAVEALHGQALLAGHHPLHPADTARLARAFDTLLVRATPTRPTGDTA
jgi:molecular chaperone HtpG